MEQLIRHLPEIVVDEANPFLYCKLGRESIAPILTDVVSTYGQTGIVIALDGTWGSGKTTFVRMWTQYLKNNGFAALYFNAWECDFVDGLSVVSCTFCDSCAELVIFVECHAFYAATCVGCAFRNIGYPRFDVKCYVFR